MSLSKERKVAGIFLLALGALALARLIAHENTSRLMETERTIQRTQGVRAAIAGVLSAVQEAESQQRAYLITGDEAFVARYQKAATDVAKQLENLQAATSDSTAQRKQFQTLSQLVGQRLAQLDAATHIRRDQGVAAAADGVRKDYSNDLMDQIRSVLGNMAAQEESRLAEEQQGARGQRRSRFILFTGVTALDMALLTVAYWITVRYVAHRNRSEKVLRESEERFRKLAESSPVGVAFADLNGGIKEANDAFLGIIGCSRDDLRAGRLTWESVTAPEFRGAMPEVVVGNNGNHDVPPSEKEYLRKDGGRVPVLVKSARLAFGTNDTVSYVIDCTELHQTQRLLHENQERFRKIFEESPLGMAVASLDHRFLGVNATLCRILGYTEQELLGLTFNDITDPADLPAQGWLTRQLLEGKIPNFRIEKRYRRKDGEAVWVAVTASTIRDADGQPVCTMAMIEDVGDRKRVEAEITRLNQDLRRRISELQTLFDLAPIGIAVTNDPACDFIIPNPEFARLFGVTWDGTPVDCRTATRKFRCVSNGNELTPQDLPIHSAAATGVSSNNVELLVELADGKQSTLLANASPLFDENGNTRGAIGAIWDITPLKKIEEQMKSAMEAAEAANRAKDRFLAMVSHDLRTPLGAILVWTHLLRKASLDENQRLEAAQNIEKCARAQAQLVDDLLDASRIIFDKFEVDLHPMNLSRVLEQAVDAVRPSAEAKNIRLTVEQNAENAPTLGDANRLQQVFWNLLSNAVKFSPPGSSVHVSLEVQDAVARIRVIDTGEGISPEFLPHVFERFSQHAASAAQKRCGLGLGLSIVRHIVELHDGTVTAESEGPGRGSTFTVNLRLIESPTADAETPSEDDGDSIPSLENLRVLVVDDREVDRQAVSQFLSQCGADVSAVSGAEEALEAVQNWRPDVLISDIMMPGIDGYGLIERVRSLAADQGGDTRALALTACDSTDDFLKALGCGFDQHMSKPMDPRTLATSVARLARRPRRINGDSSAAAAHLP